jgi:hypothetical protein
VSNPNSDELWHGGSHVFYELDQLSAMYVVLARLEHGHVECEEEVQETLRLATLEALLLHTRCVIEFLVGRPTRSGARSRKSQDIPPTWFAPTWVTPPGTHRLDRWLAQLDANVSHLSRERIRIGDLGQHEALDWGSEMFRELAEELGRFVEEVDDTEWRASFRRATERLTGAIDEYPDLASGS